MEGGPPGFPRDSSCPAVLWCLPADSPCRLHDYHILWFHFPEDSTKEFQCICRSATPRRLLLSVWPLSLSLATTKDISVDFFSSPYLDVSVQAVPFIYLWIQYMMHEFLHADCSIRKSAGQSSLTAHRSLSQLTTSFIGSQCQGIHPALIFALPFVNFLCAIIELSYIVFTRLDQRNIVYSSFSMSFEVISYFS